MKAPANRRSAIQLFESREAPFDCVYWVPARARSNGCAIRRCSRHGGQVPGPGKDARRPSGVPLVPRCRRRRASSRAAGRLTLKKAGLCIAGRSKTQVHLRTGRRSGRRGQAALAHEGHQRRLGAAGARRATSRERAEVGQLRPTATRAPPPAVVPVNDATPLALRGRFKEHMSLEFASEVLRQIQRQLESRDDRGRPLILAARRQANRRHGASRRGLARAARNKTTPAAVLGSPTRRCSVLDCRG